MSEMFGGDEAVDCGRKGQSMVRAWKEDKRARGKKAKGKGRTTPTAGFLPPVRVLASRRTFEEAPNIDEEQTRTTRIRKLLLRTEKALVSIALFLKRTSDLVQVRCPLHVVRVRA
jgi:hypothetical protein